MSKHTAGPWSVGKCKSSGGYLVLGPADDIVADVGATSVLWANCAELKANAHLIAAAPDLLEACKALRGLIISGLPMCELGHAGELARAAIRKAERRV